MSKDEIIKRIHDLTLQKRQQEALCEQSKANANACSGAIQELTGWLKKLEEKEKEEIKSQNQDPEKVAA